MANEVRTGLEDAVVTHPTQSKKEAVDVLDAQWMGKSTRLHVCEFGTLFSVIGLGVSIYKTYTFGTSPESLAWAFGAIVMALLGYRAPRILYPLWKGGMKLAHYMSVVMTFVIMLLTWTIGFVPMAIILKTLRVKRIDLSYKSGVDTYWETRDSKHDDFKRLELQF